MSHLFYFLFSLLLMSCIEENHKKKENENPSIYIVPSPKYRQVQENSTELESNTSKESLNIVAIGNPEDFPDEEMTAMAHYVSLKDSSDSLNLIFPTLGRGVTNSEKIDARAAAAAATAKKEAQLAKTKVNVPTIKTPHIPPSPATVIEPKILTPVANVEIKSRKVLSFEQNLSPNLAGRTTVKFKTIDSLEELRVGGISLFEENETIHFMHSEIYNKISAPYSPRVIDSLYIVEKVPVGDKFIVMVKLK